MAMVVITADPPSILNTEPWIAVSEPWIWSDVRKNGEDKFIRQFENYENGTERVSIRSKG